MALTVTASGGSVEFDCAHGTIEAALVLDAGGQFSAPGSYVVEHGGPIRQGEQPDVHPARYDGLVRGTTMSLTVHLTDSNTTVGPFSLTYGSSGRVLKCL